MTGVGPSAAGGDQVWLRYSVRGDHIFCYGRSGGTIYSATDGPGGPILRGDHPRRDRASLVPGVLGTRLVKGSRHTVDDDAILIESVTERLLYCLTLQTNLFFPLLPCAPCPA